MNKPARKIGISTRSYTGRVSSGGTSTAFESALERDFLVLLDFERDIETLCEQPVKINYTHQGRRRVYTPDFLVVYRYDGTVLYEIKFREDLKKNWVDLRPRFRAAVAYCRQRGWHFKILTEVEIRGVRLENARFLRGYGSRPPQDALEEHVVRTLAILGRTTPEILMKAAFKEKYHRMAALSALWRLVAIGRVRALLDEPISLQTPVWVVIGEGFAASGP
ncbi:MAG: TnsA endonuclease N-terminal domain-containing protein [Wenzhouxiangellaceae bacterium]